MSDPVKDRKWPTLLAVTVACAINRQKGFTSVSSYTFNEPSDDNRWTNKDILSYTLVPEIASKDFKVMIKTKPCDLEEAEAIVKYYRRLSFGVMSEQITEYMTRVFQITQSEEVSFADFGVLASVPSVYQKEVTAKETLDQIKTTLPEHIGEIGNSITLDVVVIDARYVKQIECWSHEAITSTNHLVSFLSKTKLLERKDTARIRAKVKKHTEHYKAKSPETQLNYVKVVDDNFVWQ